jgi:hypothetical protein
MVILGNHDRKKSKKIGFLFKINFLIGMKKKSKFSGFLFKINFLIGMKKNQNFLDSFSK